MRYTMLSIPIDAVTRKEAIRRISVFLDEPRGHIVTTPNPEMLVDAQHAPAFLSVLASADLAIPDGIGLLLFGPLLGAHFPERVSGSDLAYDLAELAAERNASLFLLGDIDDSVSARAGEALRLMYPGLRIAGALSGGKIHRDSDGIPRIDPDALSIIRQANPTMLFVGFGHGVQEEWIAAHLHLFPSIRVAIGVGGTFGFLAGTVRRAPRILRMLGLEWLWRLFREPRRIRRIIHAVIVFPYLVIRSRIATL